MGGSASLKACCLMYFLIQEKATMCTICIIYIFCCINYASTKQDSGHNRDHLINK